MDDGKPPAYHPRGPEELLDLLGRRARAQIHVLRLAPEQIISYGAAHNVALVTPRSEGVQDLPGCRRDARGEVPLVCRARRHVPWHVALHATRPPRPAVPDQTRISPDQCMPQDQVGHRTHAASVCDPGDNVRPDRHQKPQNDTYTRADRYTRLEAGRDKRTRFCEGSCVRNQKEGKASRGRFSRGEASTPLKIPCTHRIVGIGREKRAITRTFAT